MCVCVSYLGVVLLPLTRNNLMPQPCFFCLSSQGKFVVENVPGGVLVGNHTLVLQNVIRSHAGLYTCVASNQEGDAESNAQYLNVKCECPQGFSS